MPRSSDSRALRPAGRARLSGVGGDLGQVYTQLRQAILSGVYVPGDFINQVHVAREMGVSRTPVREALRLLQAEGLVEAQFQHRMRVTAVNADEVDEVYSIWILVQALAVRLAVPRASEADRHELARLYERMQTLSSRRGRTGRAEWERLHQQFHRKLVASAGPVINASIETCWARSERTRRAHLRSDPESWQVSDREHREVLDAYQASLPERAVEVLSRQLARVAVAVIRTLDPNHPMPAITNAMRQSAGNAHFRS